MKFTLDIIMDMMESIGMSYEINYASNCIYKYEGNLDARVLVASGYIMFLFDETGTLQDLWAIE